MKIIDIKQYKGNHCLSLNGERLYVSEFSFDYSLSTKKIIMKILRKLSKSIFFQRLKHALYSLGRKSYTYKELNNKLKSFMVLI